MGAVHQAKRVSHLTETHTQVTQGQALADINMLGLAQDNMPINQMNNTTHSNQIVRGMIKD
jgi:hypothetical protein